MAELQASDDTRGVEDVPNLLEPGANCPTTVLEESQLPGGWSKLNQPVGPKQPLEEIKVGLRGQFGK